MRRNYKYLGLLLLLAFASCSFTTKTFSNPDKDKLLVQVITYVLERGHFDPKTIDDEFSEEVYNNYLKSIDPLKRYFYVADIEEFEEYKDNIDDQLRDYDISFFNLTNERLIQRMLESKALYKEVLNEPFDYTVEEEFNVDYDNKAYAKSKKEMKDRWRQQLKFSTIANYDDLQTEEHLKKQNEPGYKMKSDSEMEKEARAATLKSIDNYYSDYIDDLERSDWFTMYVNAVVESFDPHTFYFAPEDKDRFDQQMSGKLEGIGARLQKKADHVKIMELISGGPAWRGNELEVGDVILKVRQENETEAVNIVGMRLDDAIKFIKGPKGTEVILTIKKVDGSTEDIAIVRDVVELEETYAKSSLVTKNDIKYGVINLPKFYIDFENYNNRNAASDIKIEIDRLKEAGIEGLVLDLRNNGGGSLQTVVDMAGLFIKEGPVVQVKSTGEPKEILRSTDESVEWDGPLVILVNELSASASEILAAAMQDYKRAIIIGSKQTYGKGTVQNVIDLNRMVRNNSNGDLGALKLTTQKFYRINGGSTQLEGVKSDVVVPDRYSYIDIGEKDQNNPLPWDKIAPAEYTLWNGQFDYDSTIKKSKDRMSNSAQLSLIEDNAKWIKLKMDDNLFNLNYVKYKEKLELNEEESKRFDEISEYTSNLTYSSLPYEEALFVQDSTLREKRERWHANLTQDVYMEEAVNVLEDLNGSYSVDIEVAATEPVKTKMESVTAASSSKN